MIGYTKGPWVAGRDCVGPRSLEDDQSYGMIIPVAYIELYENPENSEANKNLIAAAPDLLEALTDALEDYDEWMKDADVTPSESVQAWTNKARTAIAKAKGGHS